MVSILHLISSSSCLFLQVFKTAQSAPITIGISVTLMYIVFFFLVLLLGQTILSIFCALCYFYFAVSRNGKINEITSFFPCELKLGLVGIMWFVCISKSQGILCVLFSKMDSDSCLYHLVARSNFNLLHNSQWIAFPTQSCLVCSIRFICD